MPTDGCFLRKNSIILAVKNNKHIKNRFFLIPDKVANEDVVIQHTGTKNVWVDVNTRSVQGLLFRKFRHKMTGEKEHAPNADTQGQEWQTNNSQ